jgi:outer membrane protein assembly factor BamB
MYRLRLSRPGLPEQVFQFMLAGGRERQFDLSLDGQLVGEPLRITGKQNFEVMRVGERAALVHFTPKGLRCVDLTGDFLWDTEPGTVEPPGLLAADGSDLIWASGRSSVLLALSGRSGKVLWRYRARPPLPAGVDETQVQWEPNQSQRGRILGRPVRADLDGRPVFFVRFAHFGEDYRLRGQQARTPTQHWIEAVSGQTHQRLWRWQLDPRWLAGPVRDIHDLPRRFALEPAELGPRLVRVGARPAILVQEGTVLAALDAVGGKPLWVRPLDFEPVRSWAGSAHIFVLRLGKDQRLSLLAYRLSGGEKAWERDLGATWPGHFIAPPPPADWLLEADLGGGPAVLVAAGSGEEYGLDVFDAASGRPRWKRRWSPANPQSGFAEVARAGGLPPLARFLVGPDLDGDGSREVFVAFGDWSAMTQARNEPAPPASSLRVEALSGRDGHTLWRGRHVWGKGDGSDRPQPGPLRWWSAGPDGWPLLGVSTTGPRSWQDGLVLFAAESGRVLHSVPGVKDIRLADLDGDGVEDLCYVYRERLHALRGRPVAWRRLTEMPLRPAPDLDGDGIPDWLEAAPSTYSKHWLHRSFGRLLAAVSGRDGHTLWRTNIPSRFTQPQVPSFLCVPAPAGDFDGDGVPDLLAMTEDIAMPPLLSLSGANGKRLWEVAWSDLDEKPTVGADDMRTWSVACTLLDGRPFVLFGYARATQFLSGGEAWGANLVLLAGNTGKKLWQTSVGSIPILLSGVVPPLITDVNGDGKPDVLFWARYGGGLELRALDLATGAEHWRQRINLSAPCPLLVADLDGDGKAEIVLGRPANPLTTPRPGGGHLEYGMEHSLEQRGVWVDVLNGGDGRLKWNYRDKGTLAQVPLLLRTGAKGRAEVGLLTGSGELLRLDGAEGKLRSRLALRLVAGVRTCDLDGGRDELLFVAAGKLRATDLTGKALWERPLTTQKGQIVETGLDAGGRPTVLLKDGGRMHLLDGRTGQTRWLPFEPPTGAVAVLREPDKYGLARAVMVSPHGAECRLLVPPKREGDYLLLTSARRSYDGTEGEDEPRGPLSNAVQSTHLTTTALALPLVVVFVIRWLTAGFRGRIRAFVVLLLVAVFASLIVLMLFISPEDSNRTAGGPLLWAALLSGPALVGALDVLRLILRGLFRFLRWAGKEAA